MIPPPSPTTVKQYSIPRPVPIPSSSSLKPISSSSKPTSISDRKEHLKTIIQTNSIPQLTYCDEYDMTQLLRLIKQIKQKVSYFSFIIKASSQVLFDYPILNSHIDSKCETIIYKVKFTRIRFVFFNLLTNFNLRVHIIFLFQSIQKMV